jgi:hypothetical protein
MESQRASLDRRPSTGSFRHSVQNGVEPAAIKVAARAAAVSASRTLDHLNSDSSVGRFWYVVGFPDCIYLGGVQAEL